MPEKRLPIMPIVPGVLPRKWNPRKKIRKSPTPASGGKWLVFPPPKKEY